MKQKFITLLLLLIPALMYSQNALMVYNESKGKKYVFKTDRRIKLSMKHNLREVHGKIICVTDSFMVVNHLDIRDTVPFSDILSVKKATVFHVVMRVYFGLFLWVPAYHVEQVVTGKWDTMGPSAAVIVPLEALFYSIPLLIHRRNLIISDFGWKLKPVALIRKPKS